MCPSFKTKGPHGFTQVHLGYMAPKIPTSQISYKYVLHIIKYATLFCLFLWQDNLGLNLFDVLVARDGVVTSVKRTFTKTMLLLATRTPNGFE